MAVANDHPVLVEILLFLPFKENSQDHKSHEFIHVLSNNSMVVEYPT